MIVITGATGYVGRHLVARLVSQGERPRCLVRDIRRAEQLLPADKIELVEGDTLSFSALKEVLQGAETVIHAAFITADHKQTPGNRYEETNVGGTANLILTAKEANVGHMIEISGLGTRADKPGTYMQGRYLAEKMLMDSGLAWTIIRPSVLFGHNAPFIKALVNLIQTAPVLPLIGGGRMRFQPISVEDVITIILKVLADPEQTKGNMYTIGGPAYYTFTQIIDALLLATRERRLKVYAPKLLVGVAATVMEVLLAEPPLTRAAMTLFSFDNITDLDSVKRDFGFTPVSFTQYLEEHGI